MCAEALPVLFGITRFLFLVTGFNQTKINQVEARSPSQLGRRTAGNSLWRTVWSVRSNSLQKSSLKLY